MKVLNIFLNQTLSQTIVFASEFETILTSVELEKKKAATEPTAAADESAKKTPSKKKSEASKAPKKLFVLTNAEEERIARLLKRSVDKESGKVDDTKISEDNPDGRKCEGLLG